jgi:hypothetical protein
MQATAAHTPGHLGSTGEGHDLNPMHKHSTAHSTKAAAPHELCQQHMHYPPPQGAAGCIRSARIATTAHPLSTASSTGTAPQHCSNCIDVACMQTATCTALPQPIAMHHRTSTLWCSTVSHSYACSQRHQECRCSTETSRAGAFLSLLHRKRASASCPQHVLAWHCSCSCCRHHDQLSSRTACRR